MQALHQVGGHAHDVAGRVGGLVALIKALEHRADAVAERVVLIVEQVVAAQHGGHLAKGLLALVRLLARGVAGGGPLLALRLVWGFGEVQLGRRLGRGGGVRGGQRRRRCPVVRLSLGRGV